jgi:glycosyltransferase involved in cell wall biosynthesis
VKGVDVLLDAMAKFLSAGGKGHLYLFGGGPEEETIRERAAMADLRAHVSVGGFADEPTYVAHLKACGVTVIPSRMESIPVVLSDALHMGKPVIVSDVGDMGALLRETPAGIVVPPENTDALAGGLAEMAAADRGRYAASVAALAERFDIAETAKRWAGEVLKVREND